jgi:hypothetical protein
MTLFSLNVCRNNSWTDSVGIEQPEFVWSDRFCLYIWNNENRTHIWILQYLTEVVIISATHLKPLYLEFISCNIIWHFVVIRNYVLFISSYCHTGLIVHASLFATSVWHVSAVDLWSWMSDTPFNFLCWVYLLWMKPCLYFVVYLCCAFLSGIGMSRAL